MTKTVTSMSARHAFETPEYWESRARSERAFAKEDRRRRYGTIESIRLHEQNAREAEAEAQRLRLAYSGELSNLELINECALWIAAGVSPSLLGTDVPSSTPSDSNSCPSEAKVTGVLADLQRLWFCNDYYIRINGEPVSVEIDVDVTGDSQSLQEVCTVKLHGDCPHCLNVLETQDNEYSYERRGYCGEDEFIVCECGAEWPLLHGTPIEFRKAVR